MGVQSGETGIADERRNVAVLKHDGFGDPRRSRGEEHGGSVPRLRSVSFQPIGWHRLWRDRRSTAEGVGCYLEVLQRSLGLSPGHYELGPAVEEHEVPVRVRVAHVHRDIGGPGLEDSEDRYKDVDGAVEVDPHPDLHADSSLTKVPRQIVGPLVQVPVCQGLPRIGHGRMIWEPGNAGCKELRECAGP